MADSEYADKGSKRWIQVTVEKDPGSIKPDEIGDISWVSPLREEGFKEYRDTPALKKIRQSHLQARMKEFWPSRGPWWDALGITESGQPVLVEAKSHFGELSRPSKAEGASRQKIQEALQTVKLELKVQGQCDWLVKFYQYANRHAYLWFLHSQGIDAHLVFVSFLNDTERHGPTSEEEWEAKYQEVERYLGLPERHDLSDAIHHVYPDVNELKQLIQQSN